MLITHATIHTLLILLAKLNPCSCACLEPTSSPGCATSPDALKSLPRQISKKSLYLIGQFFHSPFLNRATSSSQVPVGRTRDPSLPRANGHVHGQTKPKKISQPRGCSTRPCHVCRASPMPIDIEEGSNNAPPNLCELPAEHPPEVPFLLCEFYVCSVD